MSEMELEDDIFKSLGHKKRREIIKAIAMEQLAFSEIKKKIDPIDSPSLSYHLKSLQPLLEQEQKESKYKLSEIGKAAYRLLQKTDQSQRIDKGKKNFVYAYATTVICWITAESLLPIIVFGEMEHWIKVLFYHIIINAISLVNYFVIIKLRLSWLKEN
ncbi:MAG: hypothetical protein ACFFCS_02620 [Candidatus Hodarchaeota archaeon]